MLNKSFFTLVILYSFHRPLLHQHSVIYITHKVAAPPQLTLKEKTKFK